MIPSWVHLYAFLLSSLPIWTCWLDSQWVIPCQVHLCPPNLILLAWQLVSNSMPGPAAMSLLTALIHNLVLLAWQQVSDLVSRPAVPSYYCCFHSQFCPVGLTASRWSCASLVVTFELSHCHLILLAWQQVSNFMPSPTMSHLTILTSHI